MTNETATILQSARAVALAFRNDQPLRLEHALVKLNEDVSAVEKLGWRRALGLPHVPQCRRKTQ